MKKILILCIAITFGYACTKHHPSNVCQVGDNPIEELPWLKDTIRSLSHTTACPDWFIKQYSTAEQNYFLQVNNSNTPFCISIPILYDCKGKVICGGYPQQASCEALIDSAEVKGKLIWKSE